jgi:hypothetical protein
VIGPARTAARIARHSDAVQQRLQPTPLGEMVKRRG